MTYKKNFVACIKVNNQILRESHDRVELPFGSEYSILLKNLDSVRMQARISIDGKDATPWLVITPGQSIDVERFVEDLNSGNRFKFIERTASIEQHRGVQAEDGLVRIEFKREKVYEVPKVVEHHNYYHHNHYPCLGGHTYYPSQVSIPSYTVNAGLSSGSGVLRSANLSFGTINTCSVGKASESLGSVQNVQTAETNDAGITVSGSISGQRFIYVPDFPTESAEVVVLHLVGQIAQAPVKVAKTVKIKIECGTCGKKNKSLAKFCIECGTCLQKV